MYFGITQKTIIKIIFLTIGSAFVLGVIIAPTVKEIQTTSQDIDDLKLFLEKRKNQTTEESMEQNLLNEMEIYMADKEKLLFTKKDALKLVQFLEDTATRDHVSQKITDSNLDKITAGKSLTLNLSVEGDYLSLLDYIRNLETSDYFSNIQNLSLNSLGGSRGELFLKVNLYVNE